MARRGKAGTRNNRLKILGAYFKDLYGTSRDYPTVTELAKKFSVTTPTIYHDLEILRKDLGTQYVPIGLKLGGKEYERRG